MRLHSVLLSACSLLWTINASASCPPVDWFDTPPVTKLEKQICIAGRQQYNASEVFNIEKKGFGRIILSVVSVHAEQGDTDGISGLDVQIGPYGSSNDSYSYAYIDSDEVEPLTRFLDDAIRYSAKKEDGPDQLRAMVFRTKDGWLFISKKGDLGSVSVRTGEFHKSWSKEVVLTAEESRNLQKAIVSALDTLKVLTQQ
jgi:hypothetical protein